MGKIPKNKLSYLKNALLKQNQVVKKRRVESGLKKKVPSKLNKKRVFKKKMAGKKESKIVRLPFYIT